MSIQTSAGISIISKALLAFQGTVDGVGKDKVNPGFKSRYATLEAVRDAAVPALQSVGVVYLQSAGAIVEGVMAMTTRLIHAESGEWIEGTMDIPLGKKDPQGMGSAQTYAQRYHLMAMLGLPAVDDDGEAAMERKPANVAPAPSKANSREDFTAAEQMIRSASSKALLKEVWSAIKWDDMPKDWVASLTAEKDAKLVELNRVKPVVEPNFDNLPQ